MCNPLARNVLACYHEEQPSLKIWCRGISSRISLKNKYNLISQLWLYERVQRPVSNQLFQYRAKIYNKIECILRWSWNETKHHMKKIMIDAVLTLSICSISCWKNFYTILNDGIMNILWLYSFSNKKYAFVNVTSNLKQRYHSIKRSFFLLQEVVKKTISFEHSTRNI